MGSFITVQSFPNRIEAEVAKGLLEANGIKSIIFCDDGGGMRPFPMAYVMGAELKVFKGDLENAKEILKIKRQKA